MIHLIISIAMLAVAPLIYFGATRFHKLWKLLENIIIILVTCLVVLHLLPESIRNVGTPAIILAFLGLFLPSLLERLWSHGAGKVHVAAVGLALSGLIMHGMMDGAALAVGPSKNTLSGGNHLLQLAVILHRLPAALFIWGVFYPRRGSTVASTLLFMLGLATLVGYFAAEQVLAYIHSDASSLFQFQAIVAGSLLHIAFDRHDHGDHNPHQHDHD